MAGPSLQPRYAQIAETMKRDIAAGRLGTGDRLMPEREMAASLGVDVGTLRKALASLEDQGLLERRQGSGNYVGDTAEIGEVYGFFRLERIGGGGPPTAEVLDVARLPKPPGQPRIGPSPDGHRIRRLRRIGGVASAVEEIWLDAAVADTLPRDLPDALYHHYGTAFDLHVAAVEDAVGAARAPAWAPPAFAPGPGALVGHVGRRAFDRDGAPAEHSETWFDFDKVRYMNRIR